MNEKDIQISMAISRPSGRDESYISIELRDEESRTRFIDVKIPLAQFSEALTGLMVSGIPAHVRGLDVVGKRKIIEPRSKEYPLKGHTRDLQEKWLVENAQEEGWILDPYLGSQGSVVTFNGKTVLNYHVHKYVDIPES